jgi:hypothetical protein
VDDLYVFPALLDACCRVIGQPFKLSSLHSRTLRPAMPNQDLHVDVRRGSADWPLLGFIFMVDEFRVDNGATRFVPVRTVGPRRRKIAYPTCRPMSRDKRWRAEPPARCSSSTARPGTATQRTSPAGPAVRFRARSFRGTDRRQRTGALECSPRHARDSRQSRATFSICEREFVSLTASAGSRQDVGEDARHPRQTTRCRFGGLR